MTEENIFSLSGFINWVRDWFYTKNEVNALLSAASGGVSSYRNYTIVPSTYNPTIDENLSVTVTVTDMQGNPKANEEATLYYKVEGLSEVSIVGTTGSNGSFTINSIPMSDWGIVDFRVGTEHCQVNVEGWRYLHGNSSSTWAVLRTKTMAKFVLRGWSQPSKSETSSWNDFGGNSNYASSCRPHGYVMGINGANSNVFRIEPSTGHIQYRALHTAQNAGTSNHLDTTWAIRDEDL